jgi:hypothetical protein
MRRIIVSVLAALAVAAAMPLAAEARKAMGIDWMTRPELAEAIPPAYTEFIGHQLAQQAVAA